MFRKFTTLVLLGMFCFSTIVSAQSDMEIPMMKKLTMAENALYGQTQSGPLMERIAKAEKDFYGQETTKTMLEKVDFLYDTLFVNREGQASALTQVNAIEWAITHEVSSGPLKHRVENLEMMIEGNHREAAIQERMAYLANLAYAGGSITLKTQAIPVDTLVKIKLNTAVDSKTANAGDSVNYQVAEDVVVDGVLVLPKGAEGVGTILKVSRSHNFGRDAKVEIDFAAISAVDESKVATLLGEKAQKETESMAIAAGATIAGLVVLGPVGIVTGAFIKGKEVKIPEGTEMYIQTKEETSVFGVAS